MEEHTVLSSSMLEEEVPALSEHGSLWIWTAREMSFSPVDVGFQESLLVP